MTCLVCDFGGTRIKVGLVADGRLKSSAILPTLAEEPMRSTMDRVAERIESLCHESRDIGAYDSCPQGCVYCYAVSDAERAMARRQAHDPDGPYLHPPR